MSPRHHEHQAPPATDAGQSEQSPLLTFPIMALREPHPRTVAQRLFDEPYCFDFFQAVCLLERLHPCKRPVGHEGAPQSEIVRFQARQLPEFPASAIYDIEQPAAGEANHLGSLGAVVGDDDVPRMTVTFMGLTGTSGILPRHYTDALLHVERHRRGPESRALRDWLDMFNHRLISLFFRAWEKYRFYVPFARGESCDLEPDTFTTCLFSFAGLSMPSLRKRLRLTTASPDDDLLVDPALGGWASSAVKEPAEAGECFAARHNDGQPPLAEVKDLSLLYYSGLLAQRPRSASNLQAMVQDYFQLPTKVLEFQGQWLIVEHDNLSQLSGSPDGNCGLGTSLVAGSRVWDVQSKFRIRIGPLSYDQFVEFLPDRAPTERRKAFFLLSHLVRLFVGPEFDFDVQLVLEAAEVPRCELRSGVEVGSRLGWNSWLGTQPAADDVDDAAFEGEDVRWL